MFCAISILFGKSESKIIIKYGEKLSFYSFNSKYNEIIRDNLRNNLMNKS